MFKDQIEWTMDVYVDGMLVKLQRPMNHMDDLQEMFDVLQKYVMELNLLECSFGVTSSKILNFIVNSRGIEANSE